MGKFKENNYMFSYTFPRLLLRGIDSVLIEKVKYICYCISLSFFFLRVIINLLVLLDRKCFFKKKKKRNLIRAKLYNYGDLRKLNTHEFENFNTTLNLINAVLNTFKVCQGN